MPCAGGLEAATTPWGDALPKGEVPEGPLEGPWPVGRGTPNGFGLLDPGTVVHEWCADRYAPTRRRRASEDGGGASPSAGRAAAAPGGIGSAGPRPRPAAACRRDLRYADYGFRVLREED